MDGQTKAIPEKIACKRKKLSMTSNYAILRVQTTGDFTGKQDCCPCDIPEASDGGCGKRFEILMHITRTFTEQLLIHSGPFCRHLISIICLHNEVGL